MSTTARNASSTTTTTMNVDSALSVAMNRRRLVRLLGASTAAVLVTGLAVTSPASAAPSAGSYFTTTDLNLRAKPSGTAKVLLIMPQGVAVEEIGMSRNGYLKVRYQGKAGYAYLDYLTTRPINADPTITGMESTNTDVNLRSGPGTNHSVLRVLAPHTEISISDKVIDGFRYVVHLGLAGWVWDEYIGGSIGSDTLTTTSALNHRARASITAKVLSVIPAGAVVTNNHESANGYRLVTFKGVQGWCAADYLA